jgi:hypothetical protein
MTDSLHNYILNNNGKLLQKWLHYFDIYERHFSRFRNKSPVMFEIGVRGGSLDMWKWYFGEGCKIIGLDIDPACKQYESENVEIFIGDQSNPGVIDTIMKKYPHIDIVLDDGSHFSKDIKNTFKMLYDHVSDNGVYYIEDTHGCYFPMPPYNGGVKQEGNFMEFAKDRIDDLHANSIKTCMTDYLAKRNTDIPYGPPVSAFTKSTDSMHFYDSVVVFEKRKQPIRRQIITQGL